MYNLFVSGNASDWNGDPWTVERRRCVQEYTDDDLKERFGALQPQQIDELRRLPCVFAYEGWKTDPKFGFIQEVILLQDQGMVKVKYDLRECDRFVTAEELHEMRFDIGIQQNELGRTHWAVKDVDLARVLREKNGISLPGPDLPEGEFNVVEPVEPIPEGLRVALREAMGGWGPYSVREIETLFETHEFHDHIQLEDVGGVRRTCAEEFQRCIDWSDAEQRRRYLMLVEEVLSEHDPDDARAKNIRRALKIANIDLPSDEPTDKVETSDDLWRPAGAPRVFLSHLAKRKAEVHALSRLLEHFGFSCFVAHEAIEPSREWRREIERALNSCDLLVAYVTLGFSGSEWADQEVGWALGRGLAVIPVKVDGQTPYGFIGSYQAVTKTKEMKPVDLSRRVFRAICDAVFNVQRPEARKVAEKVVPLVIEAVGRASQRETAVLFCDLCRKIPVPLWTSELRDDLMKALDGNYLLLGRVQSPDESGSIADFLRKHVGQISGTVRSS